MSERPRLGMGQREEGTTRHQRKGNQARNSIHRHAFEPRGESNLRLPFNDRIQCTHFEGQQNLESGSTTRGYY